MEKDKLRIIEMQLVLDEHGKVTVPPDLMEALGVKPGDMLSFQADKQGFRVTGREKPPYFHAATPKMPVEPVKVLPTGRKKPEFTQGVMFDVPKRRK